VSRVWEFFAKRHLVANLFVIMVVMLGLNSIFTIKRDIFPTIDFGMTVIQTQYPGAAPEDVELNVTNRIEDELKNVTGIKQITSISMENYSSITVTIDPDVKDEQKVKRDIRDAVSNVTDFPEAVTESPAVIEIDNSVIEIVEVGITGDIPYRDLRRIAKHFEKKLLDLPGVSKIERYGYRAREIQVEVSPSALEKYQVPLRDIIAAIRGRNIRATGGTLESYTSEKNVVTLSEFRNPYEVGNVVVRTTFEGPLIKVKDLAIIRDDFEEQSIIPGVKGRRAISMEVYKTDSADIIRTVDAIKKLVGEESGKGLIAGYRDVPVPAEKRPGILNSLKDFWRRLTGRRDSVSIYKYGPVQIHLTRDLSKTVEDRFNITLTNGAIGLTLVLLVLTLFLNFRIAFWVAMGIPIAMFGTIFMLPMFDSFLDSITLTSMVLLIGIIVDDGIIVSENISRRREMGEAPLQAAVNGLQEVFFPVLTTILTTFLAFAPMFFMTGIMGKFVFVIPLTVSLALFFSLLECTLALPSHLVRGMEKQKRTKGAERAAVRRWFDVLRRGYRKFALVYLRFRYLLLVLFIAAFAFTIHFAAGNLKFILFPSKNAEEFYTLVELDPGSTLEATAEKVKQVEQLLWDLPDGELDSFITKTGVSFFHGSLMAGENYAMIGVKLIPYSKRTRDVDQIIEELRGKVSRIEGMATVNFFVQTGGPPVGKPISIRVIGNDNDVRKKLADAVAKKLSAIKGVKDIDRDDKLGKEQVEIKINYDRLARLGLTVADIAQNVRTAFDGETVTSFRDGDEDVEFRVVFLKEAREDLSYIYNLAIPNNQGRLIKLKEVAWLETGPGPTAYRHFDGDRTTTVESDLDQDVNTSIDATNELLSYFPDIDKEYPGTQLRIGGEAEESAESMTNLLVTFIIALVGIYFLLVLLFDSFTQPLLVAIAIPFGLIGVVVALQIHGESMSFLGMMGVIGMIGVAVNDSLVLVSHFNNLRKEKPDVPARELVAEGTSDRLRAVLLTTITTVSGMLPLAYGIGGTDLYMRPMALTLGYGILFATPMTLILVPCLYTVFNDIGRAFRGTQRPSEEQPKEETANEKQGGNSSEA
jgi:multidrug efflux pump subunit AcrB